MILLLLCFCKSLVAKEEAGSEKTQRNDEIFSGKAAGNENLGQSQKSQSCKLGIKGRTDKVSLFYSKTRFKPELEIYFGNDDIQEFTSNFIMYPIEGGLPINYHLNAETAKCKSSPQTWNNFSHFSHWNYSTYHSCFDIEEDYYPNTPYQIMNSTDSNFIILYPKNQIYKFLIFGLDRSLAQCNLTSELIIEVYGEPISIVYSVCLIIIVLVISAFLIYYYHRKLNMKHAQSIRGADHKNT